MTIQKLPGTAITPGTITVVQLESTVATTVSTGGGPKITNLAITSNVNVTLDDTAVDLTGGFIRLTGTGFNTGCLVYAGLLPAASTTFISNTEVRAQLAAQSAGTYPVYLVNTDGGTAIRVPGVTYSASPAWQTASSLGDQYDGVLLNLSVVATDAVSYSVVSGSLPPGLSLNSNTGVISGTISGVVNDTVYTFTINAVDAQLQDSPRVFTINVTVSDPYFRLTTLLLTGNSGNTVVTDSSVNNFAITVVGDSRASNFSPFLTGWSNFTDCSTSAASRVDVSATGIFGTDVSYTIEGWYNFTVVSTGDNTNIIHSGSYPARWVIDASVQSTTIALRIVTESNAVLFNGTSVAYTLGSWVHIAIVNNNTANTLTFYINGTAAGSRVKTSLTTYATLNIGYGTGNASTPYFVSNFRIVNGSALYSANFTPSTIPLTAVAGTALLIFQSNRFIDASATPRTLTVYGSNQIRSFNPFGLTNTGTTGSMYFDGSGDYLTIPDNTAFALSNADWTIECWAYVTSLTGVAQIFTSQIASNGADATLGFELGLSSAGYPKFASYINNAYVLVSGSAAITPNQWIHYAAVRTGNTISVFTNGSRVATSSVSGSCVDSSQIIVIGAGGAGTSVYVNGYISNIRFVKGNAIYDAAQTTLTVPTTPLTAVANTQLLTLQNRQPHNNHTFQDSSSNNFLITRYGNATQGTFSPFSQLGWSTLFNGSNGLSVPSNAALSFSGEFTFETFVYYNAIPGSGGAASFIMRRSNSASGSSFQFGLNNTSGQFKYFITISVGSTDYDTNWNISTPSVGRWYHVAIVRDNSSNMHCWLDGVKLILSGATSNIPGTTNVPGTDVSIGWRNYYNDLYLNGYLSNLRLSAAALYSGSTFTVPAQAFDPSQANTRLLICHTRRFVDQGSANLTIGFLNAPSIQAFSPFAPTAVYSPTIHGGSAYFDGTGDYAWCTTNVAKRFEPGSGFTFECWYYDVSGSTAGPAIFEICGSTLNWNASTGVHIQLNTNSGGTQQFQWSRGDGFTTTYGWTAPAHGQWNHFAVCYNGTTTSGWLNGNRVFTSTTGWPVPSYDRFSLGGNNVTPGSYANIYLSNLRWISGTALYNVANQTITIPTGPFASTANSILLLNFTNDAIEDATGRNVIETVADARTTSVVTKWAGSHSMYFDGTGDYLAVPANVLHNQLYATTKSFTIEFWIYLLAYAGAGAAATIISTYGGGGGADGWRIETSPNSPATNIRWVSNGADTACNATIELNTWIHYAFTYNGTTVKVFKNGALGNTATTSWTNNTGRMFIGTANAGLNFPLTAYMADIRITNAERYTTTFTPPTAPARLK